MQKNYWTVHRPVAGASYEVIVVQAFDADDANRRVLSGEGKIIDCFPAPPDFELKTELAA